MEAEAAELADGAERLLVIDPKRGRVVGVMDAARP